MGIEAVKQMFELDYSTLIPSLVVIITVALVAVKFITELLEWFLIDKLGIETKWGRRKRREHDVLIATAEGLNQLTKRHEEDLEETKKNLDDFIKASTERDEKIRKELSDSVLRIEKTVDKVFQDNLSYRDKSRDIRGVMDKKIDSVIDSNKERDELIAAIAQGNMELLGDKIDQRYNKYIELDGIPENEIDEFDGIWNAYNRLNGNHGRERKYKYVKENLQIIPVKTELIK